MVRSIRRVKPAQNFPEVEEIVWDRT